MNNQLVDFLRNYRAEKEKEGLIPTIDLLIEDLEEVEDTFYPKGYSDFTGATTNDR